METHPNKTKTEVDEELYSRQLYVIGHEAMLKMMNTKVLILGLDGLGQEIAKNISLAGIKYISLYDKEKVTERSMCSGYYFSKNSVGKERDVSVLERLRTLNKYVELRVVNEIELEKYDILISVNQKLSLNLSLNDECHLKGIKFIMANARGFFMQIFCDFQIHSYLENEEMHSGMINDITTDGVLTTVDGVKHRLETGDSVKIEEEIYEIENIGGIQFKLRGYKSDKIKIGGDYEQIRVPKTVKFESLRNNLENPEIMDFEFSDEKKPRALHELFIKEKIGVEYKEKDRVERVYERTKDCLIAPICSIIGGIAAQEAIKASSSKFMPIFQFFYFDSSTMMNESINDSKNESNNINDNISNSNNINISRYQDMRIMFGEEGFKKIKEMKIFLVGAGAIGCENLKNFVCSGLGSEGEITVTDMDSIEESNLNRQFLFKSGDVGKMKSESAVKRVLELNEDYEKERIKNYSLAVNSENEKVFSDTFLSKFDIFSNALDNVEARAYMDRRSIILRKPMIDAGTLGTKGHVQSVIPFISESYSSSSDPQEKSIPLCTIKSYPFSIEHTIEWAMSEFKQHFNEEIQEISIEEFNDKNVSDNNNVNDKNDINNNSNNNITNNNSNNNSNNINSNINSDSNTNITNNNSNINIIRNVEDCLKAALALFVQSFSTSIQSLLNSFPPDHLDNLGNPFWSPPKKVPSPISFNINDKLHITYVLSCANLYAECFKIRRILKKELYAFLENILSLKEPNPIHFENSESDLSSINPLEFDKDSWHVDFVYSAANLRARNYKIKEKSKHFIRGIAGRIIPAIATTTAVVSGLSTLEIFKSAMINEEKNESSFRNSYLDLGAPFIASTELVKPKKMILENDNKKIKFTAWDRFEYKDSSLKNILKKVEEDIGDSVNMVTLGSKVIYWNICSKYDSNLDKTVSELCLRKEGQMLVYLDVLPENDGDYMIDIAVIFE